VRDHRMMRQHQVEACLARGLNDPALIADELYEGLTPRLLVAARGCVQAHMELAELRRAADPMAAAPAMATATPHAPA